VNAKEWGAAQDPQQMLAAVAGRASTRKLRYFACACCRRVWQHLEDARSRAAVEQAERYADGGIAKDDLSAAQSEASRATRQWYAPPIGTATAPNWLRAVAATAAQHAARPTDFVAKLAKAMSHSAHYALLADGRGPLDTIARLYQCDLLRDIFGNPFRLAAFSSAWRTDTALSLARQMYDSREFSAMPILADAIQDAGCDNEDILSHCRDTQLTHVRGCWVTDLVLSKH
jgi:hypothetical protein